jgi:hypothetical protein
MTRRAAPALVLTLAFAAAAAAQSPTGAQKKALEQAFKNAPFTALIDLPIVNSMVVFPSGDIDAEVYREKLKFPPSIRKGERATIRTIEVDGDSIEVIIHRGGMMSFLNRNHYKNIAWDAYQVGSRIKIAFGRRLTASDVTPTVVARALSGVLAIDAHPVAVQAAKTGLPPAAPPEAPAAELVAVEVQPSRARPGETVQLIIRVRVGGLAPGRRMEIVEERQLLFDGRPLFSTPRRAAESWANGLHTMTLAFPLPGQAPAGAYTFAGTVRTPLGVETREAIFVVSVVAGSGAGPPVE